MHSFEHNYKEMRPVPHSYSIPKYFQIRDTIDQEHVMEDVPQLISASSLTNTAFL